MTNEEYTLVASAIRAARVNKKGRALRGSINQVVVELMRVFKQRDPQFDINRFAEVSS